MANESEKNLLGIFEHFVIINAFNATAKSVGYAKAQARYNEAVEKLGDMCLRYALKMIKNNEFQSAKKYMHLAVVFKESIENDKRYEMLWELIELNGSEMFKDKLVNFERENVLIRTVSYNPPEGFVEIDSEGKVCEA